MKKFNYLVIIFVVILFVLPVRAEHRIGIIGGFNFANIDVDPKMSTYTRFGVGIIVDFEIRKNIFLCIEPMYLQKGAFDKDSVPEGRVESSFLELPLFFKYSFGKSPIKPYTIIGPTFGFLLQSEIKLDYNGANITGDMKDVTQKIDLGFGLGAGVNFLLGNISIFVEGRYTHGLNNLQKGGAVEVKMDSIIITEINFDKDENKYKNKGFQVMLGVTFPLGGK